MYAPSAAFLTPADSARAVADVYGVSLVATLTVLAAGIALLCLRASNAGTRAVMWRCALAGLLAIYAGRFVPWQWMAWVLPELLARPLVALGTVQLDGPPGLVGPGETTPRVSGMIGWLLVLYWSGIAIVLLRTVIARTRLVVVRRQAVPLTGTQWRARLREAGNAIGISTSRVQLLATPSVPVPMTWGTWRPSFSFRAPHCAGRPTGCRRCCDMSSRTFAHATRECDSRRGLLARCSGSIQVPGGWPGVSRLMPKKRATIACC